MPETSCLRLWRIPSFLFWGFPDFEINRQNQPKLNNATVGGANVDHGRLTPGRGDVLFPVRLHGDRATVPLRECCLMASVLPAGILVVV